MKITPATQTMIETLLRFAARIKPFLGYIKPLILIGLLSTGLTPDGTIKAWAEPLVNQLTAPGTAMIIFCAVAFTHIAFKAELLSCQQTVMPALRLLSGQIISWVKNLGWTCGVAGGFAIAYNIDIGWGLDFFFFPFFLVASRVFHYLFECFLQRTTMPDMTA